MLANSKGHAKSENIAEEEFMNRRSTKRLCMLALIAFWLSGCWSAVKYEAKSTAPEACLVSAVGESGTVTRRGDLLKITTPDESVALVQVTDDGKFNVVDDPKNSQELTFSNSSKNLAGTCQRDLCSKMGTQDGEARRPNLPA